jgi:hypothetical protein
MEERGYAAKDELHKAIKSYRQTVLLCTFNRPLANVCSEPIVYQFAKHLHYATMPGSLMISGKGERYIPSMLGGKDAAWTRI